MNHARPSGPAAGFWLVAARRADVSPTKKAEVDDLGDSCDQLRCGQIRTNEAYSKLVCRILLVRPLGRFYVWGGAVRWLPSAERQSPFRLHVAQVAGWRLWVNATSLILCRSSHSGLSCSRFGSSEFQPRDGLVRLLPGGLTGVRLRARSQCPVRTVCVGRSRFPGRGA